MRPLTDRLAAPPHLEATPASGAMTTSKAPDTLAVVFGRVSFAFEDHVVLRDVSFSIPSGSVGIGVLAIAAETFTSMRKSPQSREGF